MKNVYEYYDSIAKHDIEWLWYPYIPYSKLTLLEGAPGKGKPITFRLSRKNGFQ